MESNEKAKIINNMDKLVELIECNEVLLAKFFAKKFLSKAEFDALIFIPAMMVRASEFFRILITRTEAYQHLLVALQETGQDDVLQILQEEEPQPNTSAKCRKEHTRKVIEKVLRRSRLSRCKDGSVSFRVKAPSPFFTGREKELTDLHEIISSNSNSTIVISQMGSVAGLGGIGKTQLARKYIQTYGNYFDNNIIWIDAETAESASQNFRLLASDVLGISLQNTENKPKDISVIINDCYQYFKYSKCLYVFDNAEKGKYIKDYLPSNKVWVSVLITSREREWWAAVKVLNLKVFQEQEAIEFVRKSLDNSDDYLSDIQLLVDVLQYFPLALQQAVSYIRNERKMEKYSISDYLRDFKTHERTLLDRPIKHVMYDDYTKTTFTTWQISITKISEKGECGRIATNILNLMAYFEPDDIPREFFVKISEDKERDLKLAVHLLIKYSLVDGYERESMLSIHRLVQQVIRNWNESKGKTNLLVEAVISHLTLNLNKSTLNHATSVWQYVKDNKEIIIPFADIPPGIVVKLNEVAWYEKSIQFGSYILPVLKRVVGEDCQGATNLEKLLITSYALSGKFDDALHYSKLIYEKFVRMFGDKSRETIKAKLDIGKCLSEVGNYMEAFCIMNSARLELEQTCDESDPDLVSTLSITGRIACFAGEADIAETLLERTLEIQNKYFEGDRIGICETRLNFAILKANTGSKESLNIFRAVYAELQSMKENADNVIRLLDPLVIAMPKWLLFYECFEEAHTVSLYLYETSVKVLGENSFTSLIARTYVAGSLRSLNKTDEALLLYEQLYSQTVDSFGATHVLAITILNNIGIALAVQGNYQKALVIFQEALKNLEGNKLGVGDEVIIGANLCYAKCLYETGSREEGLELIKQIKVSMGEKCNKNLAMLERYTEILNATEEELTTRNNINALTLLVLLIHRYNEKRASEQV